MGDHMTIDQYIIEKLKYDGIFAGKMPVFKKAKCFWTNYRRALECSNNPQGHYKKVWIPKKNGTYRELNIPNSFLKGHQRYILLKYLSLIPVSEFAFAYREGKNIKDMATVHYISGNDCMLKLDIKRFYDGITADKVYDVFMKNFEFQKEIAVFMTNMCTFKNNPAPWTLPSEISSHGTLPQGTPTAPALSNIIMKNFDEVVGEFVAWHNIIYTRYSDDLIFSFKGNSVEPRKIITFVRAALKDEGFHLNEAKTKLLRRNRQRFSVLGININEKLQVSKKYRDKIRQEIHFLTKFGVEEHLSYTQINGTDYGRALYTKPLVPQEDQIKYLKRLLGRINYVLYIDPGNGEFTRYKNKINEIMLELTDDKETTIPEGFLSKSAEDIPF